MNGAGCERCAALDGKHFKVSEMEIGKNAPPLHPNCRCSTAPYEDSAEYDEWLENLANGGTTEEWEKQKAVEKAENDDIIASGVTDNFDRKTRPAEIAEDLAAVNPNYDLGNEYQQNCQRCVPAYELRRRGYDVTAKPAMVTESGDLSREDTLAKNGRWFLGIFQDIQWYSGGTGRDTSLIDKSMSKWGDGARSEVYIQWETGGAHVFIAEQVNGKTIFIDPQSGKKNCEYYFTSAKSGTILFARIDNLEFTDLIEECVQNRSNYND